MNCTVCRPSVLRAITIEYETYDHRWRPAEDFNQHFVRTFEDKQVWPDSFRSFKSQKKDYFAVIIGLILASSAETDHRIT